MGEHADRRDQFARALWDHADQLRTHEHERRARTTAVTALVRLALHDEPVRNAAQARRVKGVGATLATVLEAAERSAAPTATARGRYASAAAAVLVALRDLEATTAPVPLVDLLERAGALLEPGRAFADVAGLAACGAWAQVTPLEGALKLVRRRARVALEGGAAYELTDAGRAAADASCRAGTGYAALGRLRAWAPGPEAADDAIVVVDAREGGGERHWLGTIAAFLRDERVPHESRIVPSGFGDYALCRRAADLRTDVAAGVENDLRSLKTRSFRLVP